MPDGGCCACEAMMWNGEDRVVVVKKKAGRVGERRCYKAQDVSKIVWGAFRCKDFSRSRRGREGLCWELRATVLLELFFALSLLCSPMLPMAGTRIG
jgi:hypothetical protein